MRYQIWKYFIYFSQEYILEIFPLILGFTYFEKEKKKLFDKIWLLKKKIKPYIVEQE